MLAKLVHTEKIVPATVTFVDIAGIVKGASEGEGLGNKFLANIREADAICEVVRAFEDDDIVHVNGKVDPADDIDTINTELILADLQTIENALPKLEKDLRGKKDRTGLHGGRQTGEDHSRRPAKPLIRRLAKAVSTRIPSTICT